MFGWLFKRHPEPVADAALLQSVMASAAQVFSGLDDPGLGAFIRGGSETSSGACVTAQTALRNMAVLRCLSLISRSIGMLPIHLLRADTKEKATDHPLYRILARRPNDWQTPAVFKSTMQLRALVYGNAYALVVRSRGQVVRLFPLIPNQVRIVQTADWNVEYVYTRPDGGQMRIPAADMFHLRDLSLDGVSGLSRVQLAKEAIGLALQAEKAAAKLFRNGLLLGGYLTTAGSLTKGAIERLQATLDDYRGADAAQKWPVFEEGLKAEKMAQTSVESQHLENREHQITEIARAFDTPRPLLMMDETAWGSGIEQLGLFFVQFGLAPWFSAWEQEIARVLLSEADQEIYAVKFNERALLRGSLKDQADFFAKALGAGGQQPWHTQDEIRDLADVAPMGGAAAHLQPGYGYKNTAKGPGDEPAQPA
jgi:HK97 family phage portal protein